MNQALQSDDLPEWSIVVIARNEEAMIDRCLSSVTEAFNGIAYELILVDSASTDGTVEIARKHPVSIIELPETVPLRPAIGRHVGYQFTHGHWVLFLDGDMVLEPDWVKPAADAFWTNPDLAGVAGMMQHILIDKKNQRKSFWASYPDNDYQSAEYLSGSAAYRRTAIEQARGFNPFVYAGEEAELGGRLRKHGYRLHRLPIPMTQHFPKHFARHYKTLPEIVRRIRRGFYIGLGQLVRYAYTYDLPLYNPFKYIRRFVQFFMLMILGIITGIASIVVKQPLLILVWFGVMAFIFASFAARARSIRKPFYYFMEWSMASPFVIWGFLQRPRSAEEFPALLSKPAIFEPVKDA